MSLAFIHGAKSNPNKSKWIEIIGQYKYYCYILAEFDPNRAEQIYDNPADEIAKAYVTKMAYEYQDPIK